MQNDRVTGDYCYVQKMDKGENINQSKSVNKIKLIHHRKTTDEIKAIETMKAIENRKRFRKKNDLDKIKMAAGRKDHLKKIKSLKISQCMIVKNEENNIEKALSWGKEIMWEQIVVDTGSTDHTVELAKKLGAKVVHFAWIDDFSAAKNYAISQAEGDWIALLDADEYMMPEDAKKVQDVLIELEERNLDGLSTGWQQLNDEGKIFSSGTQIRFFRNDPDIRYRRRIHEQLERISGKELRVGDATRELSIFHTGYQTKALEGKTKSKRNRKLILAELEDHPEDYEMMGYLGDDFLSDGEKEAAETWYRRSIQHMPSVIVDYDQRSAVTFTEFLCLLMEKEELLGDGMYLEEIQKTYRKAIGLLPEEADFDYVLGRFYAVKHEMKQAQKHLEMALDKLNTYGCYNKALRLSGNLFDAYEVLVRCCYELNDQQKCISYAVNYLKYNPYGVEVLFLFLRILLPGWERGETKEAQKREVFEVLSKLYDWSIVKNKVFIIKAAEKAVGRDVSLFFANQFFTPDEQKNLGLR